MADSSNTPGKARRWAIRAQRASSTREGVISMTGTVTALRPIEQVWVIEDLTLPVAPGGCVTARVEVDDALVGWVGDERVPGRGGKNVRRWWVGHRLAGDTRLRWRLDGFRTRKAAYTALLVELYGLDDAGLAELGMSR